MIKVDSSPQITRLFPLKELTEFHEKTNEIKPLDKIFGKLRATYNFVFKKSEDTSNVEKILANDAKNDDLETLKLIWASLIGPQPPTVAKNNGDVESENEKGRGEFEFKDNVIPVNKAAEKTVEKTEKDEWLDAVEAPKPLGAGLEFQDDSDDDSVVETTTPRTFQLPIALGKQLLDWLGALLGLTYGAYTRVAQAVKS